MIVYKYCDLCLNFLQFFVPVSWMLQNSESYLLSREWKKGEIKIKKSSCSLYSSSVNLARVMISLIKICRNANQFL